MMRLPYPARAFDLVVHSDTLEHVSDPGLALASAAAFLRSAVLRCSPFLSSSAG